MVQMVDDRTRGPHTLDVVLTNEPLISMHARADTPLANSDHASLCFSVLELDDSHLRGYDWTQIITTNFTADGL
jgi:hypothetical protein